MHLLVAAYMRYNPGRSTAPDIRPADNSAGTILDMLIAEDAG